MEDKFLSAHGFGTYVTCKPNRLVLTRPGVWHSINRVDDDAGDHCRASVVGFFKEGDELMPFYRLSPNKRLNSIKTGQFPRIFTFDGWKHERQFIDEWKGEGSRYEKVSTATKLLTSGVSTRKIGRIMKHSWNSVRSWVGKEGFSLVRRQLTHVDVEYSSLWGSHEPVDEHRVLHESKLVGGPPRRFY